MKVYEMKQSDIGEAVETADAIIVTLREENRVLIISRKDMKVSGIKVEMPKVSMPAGFNHKAGDPLIARNKRIARQKIERLKNMKYLNVKDHPIMGKSLNTPLALGIYKRYSLRLYNNPMAEIMSKVNLVSEPISHEQMDAIIKPVFDKYGLTGCKSRYGAVMMFLKGIGLITMVRGGMGKKAVYTVVKAPEIPRSPSIYDK